MSEFLELLDRVTASQSCCGERMPSGGEKKDQLLETYGIIKKAGITDNEYQYGKAAITKDSFYFEVLLQRKAKELLANSTKLSNEKIKLRAANMAELVIIRIKGSNRSITAKQIASQMGINKSNWHDRYRPIYESICEWCDDLGNSADIKVSRELRKERQSID